MLADKRAKPYDVLSAATLVLSVTSPDSQPYASAWQQIEDVARDPKNPGSLEALVVLANEKAVPPMPAIGGNTSLSLESTPAPSLTPARWRASAVAGGVAAGPPAPATNTCNAIRRDTNSHSSRHSAPAPAGRTMSLTEVANALENHPDARPYHKLLALEVRARQDPPSRTNTSPMLWSILETWRAGTAYQGGAE